MARSLRQLENITFVAMIKQYLGLAFVATLFFNLATLAQEITVKDNVTQQSIPNAKVFSIIPKVQRIADVEGRFQLEDFVGCDTIYVSYSGYEKGIFRYADLRKVTSIELFDEGLSISEMTVSASRWEEDKVKIPGRINKLDLREIEQLGPQTSADLLEAGGYVFVQKSQLAGGSPQLRGFGTNRVMIIVDGVRMNNAIFRAGNLQNVLSLDANSLESTEILFGPGAVMYGSDAIGGVMNFRTKIAQYSPDSVESYIRSNVMGRYSTASNEATAHFDVNIGKQKWAFLTAATYSRFGDLKAGKHGNESFLRPTYQTQIGGGDTTVVNDNPQIQVNSGYSQINAIQKIYYKPSDKWEFDLGLNFSTTSDAPRYDRLILDKKNDGQLDNAEWYYGPQQWLMAKFGATNEHAGVLYTKMRITGAYQRFKESRHDRKTGSSNIRRQFEQVDAVSLNIDLDKEIGKRATIFYGLEGVVNQIGSNAYREDVNTGNQQVINPRYPDGSTWQSYGIYGTAKLELSEKWTLNVGGRYSYYSIRAEFDTSLFAFPFSETSNANSALNGNLGLVFNPNTRSQWYINGSSGFRAPNIDDIGKVFDSEPGSVVLPNLALKPEFAYSAEVGFVAIVAKKVKLDGALYYTYLQDALARGPMTLNGQDSILYEGVLSRIQGIRNISDAHVYGFQAGIEWAMIKGLSLKSTISFQRGRAFEVDSNAYFPLAHVAPTFGRTALIYKTKQFKINLYAMYQGIMRPDDLPLTERTDNVYAKDDQGRNFTPSWYTLNIKASYYFNKHLSATAGVENITDQLYRTFGSGISAPGRNIVISIKATF